MYAKSAHIYEFKCFKKAELDLQYPGRSDQPVCDLPNTNLILGDNGCGKSSVLRAIAIAMLAPALLDSGFIAYRLARRPETDKTLLKVIAQLDEGDQLSKPDTRNEITLLARIDHQEHRRSIDRLHLDSTPESPLEKLIYDDRSHAFFVVGYGATRRIEPGEYSPSLARKQRGEHYGRVASLFEDHLALRPLEALFKIFDKREDEALETINRVLPDGLSLTAKRDEETEQYIVVHNDAQVPFSSLSDGHSAFVVMIADLVGHLVDVCPKDMKLRDCPGIVLIDEIDLHLHPSWQREVVSDLSSGFPRLQFIMSSHSPLVANTVQSRNIFVTEQDGEGVATIFQIEEQAYGRSIDQILLSSYFGLETTRPESSVQATEKLIAKVAKGDKEAAIALMQMMGPGRSYPRSSALTSTYRSQNR